MTGVAFSKAGVIGRIIRYFYRISELEIGSERPVKGRRIFGPKWPRFLAPRPGGVGWPRRWNLGAPSQKLCVGS